MPRGSSIAVAAAAALLGLSWSSPGHAQPPNEGLVRLDGTFGREPGEIVQPGTDDLGQHADYLIRGDLGEQVGGNLFHSFEQFSIGTGEVATFTGEGLKADAPTVANIISRVTGGELSDLDGTLRSTIPDANFFLLNPAGIAFGPDARLDVRSSFRASTSDRLLFSEDEVFEAREHGRIPLLETVTPVEFGFLGAEAAALTVSGSTLSGPAGSTTELAGGRVRLDDGALVAVPGGVILVSAGGAIDIVQGSALDTLQGAPFPSNSSLILSAGTDLHIQDVNADLVAQRIQMSAGESIMVRSSAFRNNSPGLDWAISAPRVKIEEFFLFGNVLHPFSPSIVSVVASRLEVENTFLGLDNVKTVELRAEGQTKIQESAIKAVEVFIDAPRVVISSSDLGNLVEFGRLSSSLGSSFVSITGKDIQISDESLIDQASDPNSSDDDAGDISISASGSIRVESGSVVRAVSPGRLFMGVLSVGGGGGEIAIAAPTVLVDGASVVTSTSVSEASSLRGGGITIRARDLRVSNGAIIDSSTLHAGTQFPGSTAGKVELQASRSLAIEGAGTSVSSSTVGSGSGGEVELRSPRITITDGALVSTASEDVLRSTRLILTTDFDDFISIPDPAQMPATGNAGSIRVDADSTLRIDGSSITARAIRADGGDIAIEARDSVELNHSNLTTSVQGGQGGNITVDPVFVILDASNVVAQAGEGTGGAIRITADILLVSPGSLISASAGPAGISGTVEIDSPTVDVAGSLATLPESALDASNLMREACAARSAEQGGRFAVQGRDGAPPRPDGWLGAGFTGGRAAEADQ